MSKIEHIENIENRSIAQLEAMRAGLLQDLGKVGPMINGSTIVAHHRCGNKTGKKTPQMRVQRLCNGKLQSTHVPRDLEETVARWNAEYRHVQEILQQIGECSDMIIRRYVKEKRQGVNNAQLKRRHSGGSHGPNA